MGPSQSRDSPSLADDVGSVEITKDGDSEEAGSVTDYIRVFGYTDKTGWICNIIAFICAIASGVTLPLVEIILGKFVSTFNDFANHVIGTSQYRKEVQEYTMYFVYLFIARYCLVYIWSTLISISAVRTTKALRVDFIRQALRQEITFLDLSGNSLSAKLSTNGNHINNGIAEKLGLIIQGISTLLAAFSVAFSSQWKLTLILIGIVPANLFITGVTVALDAGYETQMMSIFSRGLSMAEETFSTIRTVHALWAHPVLIQKFKQILDQTSVIARKKHPVLAVMYSIEFFLIFASYGLAFWQGIHRYHSGEFELGKVVTVVFAVIIGAQSLTQLSPQVMALSKAIAAATDMFKVIDRQSAIDSLSESGLRPESVNGTIRLENINFAYPSRPEIPVLRGLNLDIPAQKTTALVGTSGSGKSTIVGLVERWYEAQSGHITLDNVSITHLNIEWLRSNIRLVQQEPTLFSGTIFQNIAYGLASTSLASKSYDEQRKMVEDACKAAFAHEFIIKFPQGYDTVLGEKGATLSGGQKQRIVIARSIISNPKVLLLDEATSALDPTAEKIVQKALNNVAIGRTMVVIAHRLSTIRDADNIIVMSHGRIGEQGTHDQLMAAQDGYSRLVKAQDLGSDHPDVDTDEKASDPDNDPIPTRVKSAMTATEFDQEDQSLLISRSVDYGLLKIVFMIVREQRDIRQITIMAGLLCAIVGLTFPALAVLFGKVMEALTLPRDKILERTDFYSLMFFVVAIINFFLWAAIGWMTSFIGQVILRHYREEIFENIIKQKMSYFDNPANQTGALVSRLSSEPTNLLELMSINIGIMIYNASNIISSTILALIVGWKLGLVLLFGALLPLALSGLLKMKLEFLLEDRTSRKFASSSGLAAEAIMAIRTVSSMALERDVIRRYEDELHGITQKSCKEFIWIMACYALSQSMTFVAMTLGFWYGGRLVASGEYSTTRFYIVFLSIMFSGEAAGAIFAFGSNMTKAQVSANYIFELRQQTVEIEAELRKRGDTDIIGDEANLALKDLEFEYPQRPSLKVLKGITLEVLAGKFVAFVGASGCGKTTMINMLEQFYSPTSGQVLYNGQDVIDLNLQKYRSKMAIVQQEPVLYQGTIRENITLGREDACLTNDDVITACKQANIYDFISSLPEGLGTPCGRSGFSFSGGQRQRITIARALIRKPKLLLLDEATSALDTESERVVKEALDVAAAGRTTVAVAHRLSTIKDADIIAVIDKGRIVEFGSHCELLQKRGIYFDMCSAQSLDQTSA